MPFNSIDEAKKANFPTRKDEISLTLSQINKLAEIYDAIKKAGSAKNPMAVAWSQWSELYKKEGNKWVLIKKEGEQETNARWIPVAKANQTKHMKDGSKVVLTENALKNSIESWRNGDIIINHKEAIDGLKIVDAKYEAPFLYMQFNENTEKIFSNTDATGWSVQFVPESIKMDGENIIDGIGQGISILYAPHTPTCTPEMGCYETFEFNKEDFKGDIMSEENEIKSVLDDLKGKFEDLATFLKGAFSKPKEKKEEFEQEDMDKVEELTLKLSDSEAALAKAKSEFETMQTDSAKKVKELEDKVAAFEQEKVDARKAELSAQWETLKKEVIPPGLVAKAEDETSLKGEFETDPHAFIKRMATFKKLEEQKEDGSEFEAERNESLAAIKELKRDTGRI